MELTEAKQESVYDVVGVGFGPSNLALAIALDEYNQSVSRREQLSYQFIEKHSSLSWHRNMLVDGATMQISFLKDLVTPRNPASKYSFVSYLHARNRLGAFINHKTLFPLRLEFHDYLEWSAEKLAHDVAYSHEVIEVWPVPAGTHDQPEIAELEVVASGPQTGAPSATWRARNVVFAMGLRPWLPDTVSASERVWHSENLLERLKSLPPSEEPVFVVVGAGQSAAEVIEHLLSSFPRSQVHSVISRYGYVPADDSPFANGVFDPEAVDVFFNSSHTVKQSILDYHSNTNYSVVDIELIGSLYRRYYQELVSGGHRIHLHRMSRVANLRPTAEEVEVTLEFIPSGDADVIAADAAIFATGYRPNDPAPILHSILDLCGHDADKRLRVGLDYRVETASSLLCGIYLQGSTEHTHGLSSSLLSNVAVRAGHIVDSVVKRR
jgi:L-ornithine N5-monooxygenase